MSGTKLWAVLLLAARYLRSRRFATVVSVAAIGLSLVLVVVVGLIDFAVKKTAVQGSIRYPLIVGPEGASAAQLIFSTVFHVDKPTGTIPFAVYEKLRTDRRVLAAFPIAVADSLESYPIVGTDEALLRDLGVGTSTGRIDLSEPRNAILGQEVAARTGLGVGSEFSSSHGLVGSEEAEHHDSLRYRVVGILAATGGPEDAAVYGSYQAIWQLHAAEKSSADDRYQLGEGRLTAVLVRTASPVYTAQLEAEMTLGAGTQGVDTGRAIRRLVGYLDKGEKLVGLFAGVSLVIAAGLVLVTLVMSLNERRKELALMRSLGISRATISLIVMVEALFITLAGTAVGVALGHVAVWWSEHLIRRGLGVAVEPWRWTLLERWTVLCTLLAGQAVALAGLVWTYRLNVVEEVARD